VGLDLAYDLGTREIQVKTDSPLVVSQVKGDTQVKDVLLQRYLATVRERINKFELVEISHILREQNTRADVLSKLASTKVSAINYSFVHETLERPSYGEGMMVATCEPIPLMWMTLIKEYIQEGKLLNDPIEVKTIKQRASKHTITQGWLFKRRFSTPLLKCLDSDKVAYALEEVHEGIAIQHLGGQALARKLLRAGYYWPTMENDVMEYVRRCEKGQRYGDVFNAPLFKLSAHTTNWSFVK